MEKKRRGPVLVVRRKHKGSVEKQPSRVKEENHAGKAPPNDPKGSENGGKRRKKVLEVPNGAQEEPASSDASLRGIRKWILEYKAKRPGFAIVQQRLDEFIADYEEREEQAQKEREEAAAAEGWTLVERKKGKKKSRDSSGTSVGAVSADAVAKKLAEKKEKKEKVALDFYRFQRKEARRNEVLELQAKFEQDKKRIAQMRAARKFRPY